VVGRPAWAHILGEKKVSTLSHVLLLISLDEMSNDPDAEDLSLEQDLSSKQHEVFLLEQPDGSFSEHFPGDSLQVSPFLGLFSFSELSPF